VPAATGIPARRNSFRLAGVVTALMFRAAPVATGVYLGVTVLAGAAPGAAAYSIRFLLDELARGSHADSKKAVLFIVAAIVFGALSLTASYVASYLSSYVQQLVLCLAADRLYGRLNAFIGLRHMENPRFHDTMRLAERAVEIAPADLTVFLVGVLRQSASVAVYVGLLLAVWPPMTGLLAAAAVPAFIAQVTLTKQATLADAEIASCHRRRHYFRELLMDPSSAKEIRLFGLGSLFHGRMMAALREAAAIEDKQNRRATTREVYLSALNVAVSLTGSVIVVLAALRGHVTIGDVSLFLAAIVSTQGAFAAVIPQFGRAHRSLRLFASYLDVIEKEPDLPDGENAVPELRQGIEIRDVWFRYDEDSPWVLRGVSLTIPVGRRVGLVGVNGAGKSTLVKLLLRMYDPDRGTILWDGVELSRLRVTQLRQQVRVTSQDFVAFDLSAAENIGLGDVDNRDDHDKIRAAASAAQVDETLRRLSVGYDTLLSRVHTDDLGRTGTTLSGGQWQKVAIARAMMRSEATLLVLDEPSSGLDAEAEHEIHRILADRQPYTKLLISHRLNAIRDADIIFVLSDGRITERGTHDELVQAEGEYARLFSLQAAGYHQTPATSTPA
jgi:ATP-binding cassette subfamily B protein